MDASDCTIEAPAPSTETTTAHKLRGDQLLKLTIELERELAAAPDVVESILRELPRVPHIPIKQERIIRCSLTNLERAICRAVARAAAFGECWQVQIENH
jgi:hypothetical protein